MRSNHHFSLELFFKPSQIDWDKGLEQKLASLTCETRVCGDKNIFQHNPSTDEEGLLINLKILNYYPEISLFACLLMAFVYMHVCMYVCISTFSCDI